MMRRLRTPAEKRARDEAMATRNRIDGQESRSQENEAARIAKQLATRRAKKRKRIEETNEFDNPPSVEMDYFFDEEGEEQGVLNTNIDEEIIIQDDGFDFEESFNYEDEENDEQGEECSKRSSEDDSGYDTRDESYEGNGNFEEQNAIQNYDNQDISLLRRLIPNLMPNWPGFDFRNRVVNSLQRETIMPPDFYDPIRPNSSLTKGNYAVLFHRAFNRIGATQNQRDHIMDLNRCIFPEFDLPTAKIISKYDVASKKEYIEFHICRGGCTVFEGNNQNEYYCLKCGKPRLRQCTVKTCNEIGHCPHVESRRPCAAVRYRSLIGILVKLITISPKFLQLINYKNDSYVNDDWVIDIANSERYKHHMKEMRLWSVYKEDEGDISANTQIVNLLLGEFYDGAQVFKSKSVSFWPIFVQILNLPPHLRTKIGIGQFLLSLLYLENASPVVEKFIWEDCLVKELQILNKGYKFSYSICNGATKKETHYFLQARLVLHTLDTKGLEPLLQVHGSNSKIGCPLCRSIPGVRREEFSKTILVGHRRLLHYKHLLRSIGQSQTCCPLGYYGMNKVPEVELNGLITPQQAKITTQAQADRFNRTVCFEETSFNAGKFLFDVNHGSAEYVWHHDDQTIDLDDAIKLFIGKKDDPPRYLYYPHCDYSERVVFKRVQNIHYVRNGMTALRNRKAIEEKRRKNSKKNSKAVDGVKGLWPLAVLPYANIKDLCWDPFHVFKNIMKNLLENFKGERSNVNENVKGLCKKQKCHPYLFEEPLRPAPWILNAKTQGKVDAYFDCLIFPTGCGEEKDFLNPFSKTGMMRGHGHMQLLSNFFDYMLATVGRGFPQSYRRFYSMLSYDVSQILNPFFKITDINNLFNCVVETVCVKEGLYPESEAMYPFHQLIDLVPFIKKFGPVRGWWTFAGERAIGILKHGLPKGGQSFELTGFNRYLNKEGFRTADYYKSGPHHDCDADFMRFDGEQYYFNAYPNVLHRSKRKYKPRSLQDRYEITVYDLCQLLSCLISDIELYFDSMEEAVCGSPLYYLLQLYLGLQNKSEYLTVQKFVMWILRHDEINRYLLSASKLIGGSFYDLNKDEVMESLFREEIYPECLQVVTALRDLKVEMFETVTVLGTKFKSRGWECRESEVPLAENSGYGKDDYKEAPRNSENILINHWYEPKNYSSWCAMKCAPIYTKDLLKRNPRKIKFGKEAMDARVYQYGQLNAFMTLDLPADKFLHGMCIASVTTRAYEDLDYIDRVLTDDRESFYSYRGFVPISYIIPTHIAIAAFGNHPTETEDIPINLNAQGMTSDLNTLTYRDKREAKYLMMINIDRTKGSCLKEYYDEVVGRKAFTNLLSKHVPNRKIILKVIMNNI